MNRGLDCKDTIYELTFPKESQDKLRMLAKILNQRLADDFYCEVADNGANSPVSFIVTHYQGIDYA